MEAQPRVNDHYFQELAAPLAQDEATVLSLHETVTVPLAKKGGKERLALVNIVREQ
jgi:hypothetical protein